MVLSGVTQPGAVETGVPQCFCPPHLAGAVQGQALALRAAELPAAVWEGDADCSWAARCIPTCSSSLCSCPAFLPLLSLHLSAWPSCISMSILVALSLLYSSASAFYPALYYSSSKLDASQLIFCIFGC